MDNKSMSKRIDSKRQTNIELLRIVAMLMIVAHHFFCHGGFEFSNETITINRLWLQLINIGGKIGVDIFIIISGYFLIDSHRIRTSKVLILWLQVFTYSIVIFSLFTILKIEKFSLKELVKSVLPITFSKWWFASAYFVLYLISPYINKLLHIMDKRTYNGYILLLTLMWCIIPTFTKQSVESNSLLWFIYLYSLAGYIKLYGFKYNVKSTTFIMLSISLILLTYLSSVVFDVIGIKYKIFSEYNTFFYSQNSLPIVLSSLLLFIGFQKSEIKCSKTINIIASTTFGIYLIHDNNYMRSFLWKTLFVNNSFQDKNTLIPYSIIVILIVFFGCALIELLRKRLFEKPLANLFNRSSSIIDSAINKVLSIIDKWL